jgi:hypothetical protein
VHDRIALEPRPVQRCNRSEKVEPVQAGLCKSSPILEKTGEVMQLLRFIESIFYVKFSSEYMQYTLVFSSMIYCDSGCEKIEYTDCVVQLEKTEQEK